MILQFPDLDTFRLALTSGVVPSSVSLAPVKVAFTADGPFSLQPDTNLTRSAAQQVRKLGVTTLKKHLTSTPEAYDNWLQILPLERDLSPPQLSSQAPVLFEILDLEQLAILVGEMLRLGNDRQSYRWLEPSDHPDHAEDARVLLRVIGPPYYTLLRALDQSLAQRPDGTPAVRAYLEPVPRVWTEIGYTHPLVPHLQPPEGQMLLLHAPRHWEYLEHAPFRDVYEILKFVLPEQSVIWQDAPLQEKLRVPLRLVPGNAADLPELWVLRHNAVAYLDAFVRDADEKLMHRLAFAVAEENGEPTIVLRVRPSRQPVPVIALPEAVGFKAYWKLPNLFLPVGTRLQPTLRRERIRTLLAEDPAEVVWLYPDAAAHGGFIPEMLPDDAFRPLEDWIEYVIDHQQSALAAWMEATRFDFDSFLCPEEHSERDRPSGPGKGKGKKHRADETSAAETAAGSRTGKGRSAAGSTNYAAAEPLPNIAQASKLEPSVIRQQLDALEEQFLAIDGELDHPERQALWAHLAELNAALEERNDAAVCWLNAVWEENVPASSLLEDWVASELGQRPTKLRAADLDHLLAQDAPTPSEARSLVALLVWATQPSSNPELLRSRHTRLQAFVQAHESLLGVRAVWLAWVALSKLGDADVLSLARARDRLLQRLLDEGLNPERDLPTFLRFAGSKDSERMRLVRDRFRLLRDLARQWVQQEASVSLPYVDLLFAYGFARLGEITLSRQLLEAARLELAKTQDKQGKPDPVHHLLLKGFEHRIDEVLHGRSKPAPLVDVFGEALHKLTPEERYKIDRFRELSMILEPHEKLHPYLRWLQSADDLYKEIARLAELRSPAELRLDIQRLIKDGLHGKNSPAFQARVLAEVLPLAPRVGEDFTVELITRVPEVFQSAANLQEPNPIDKLLERALFYAAHFNRVELVRQLMGLFRDWLSKQSGKLFYTTLNQFVRDGIRGMRKLGMRDEIASLLEQLRHLILKGQSLSQLRDKNAANWLETLQTLLYIGSGWMYFGNLQEAMPILDEARRELLHQGTLFGQDKSGGSKPWVLQYARLAQTYMSVLSFAPVENALARIEEMFRHMDPLSNTQLSNSHFSRNHLSVIEEMVRAVVSEDFVLGVEARRWLDDDEFLVRRRIHRDIKSVLAGSGL